MVTGFEDMWGTATISSDGNSMEVSRTFAETDANGREVVQPLANGDVRPPTSAAKPLE